MVLILGLMLKMKKERRNEMSSEKQLQIIKDICQEHLDNTEIDSINKCEDHHDHYLLGKVDMATEIFEAIMKGK